MSISLSPSPLTLEDRAFLKKYRREMVAWRFRAAMWRLRLTLAAWDPAQPRVPAGSPQGGRWTDTDGRAGRVDDRVRVAQLAPGRGTRPYPTLRIGRTAVRITEMEEAEMVGWRINRDAALADVWRVDPNWRPPTSLWETPRGYIEALRGDTLAAEARLRDRAAETFRPFDRVWFDGTGRRDDATLCRPDGAWIGVRRPGAGPDVRTLSTSRFKSLWQELSAGSRPHLSSSRYEGHWIETRDGGVVGLRNSEGWGWTIDLRSGLFYRAGELKMRIHHDRDLEAKSMWKGVLYLKVDDYEFIVDSTPMWYFEAAARNRSGDPALQRAFLRECVLTMLAAGARPYEYREGPPYAQDRSRWQGLSPDAIADDIVEATLSAPDIFDANIWWSSRRDLGEPT